MRAQRYCIIRNSFPVPHTFIIGYHPPELHPLQAQFRIKFGDVIKHMPCKSLALFTILDSMQDVEQLQTARGRSRGLARRFSAEPRDFRVRPFGVVIFQVFGDQLPLRFIREFFSDGNHAFLHVALRLLLQFLR